MFQGVSNGLSLVWHRITVRCRAGSVRYRCGNIKDVCGKHGTGTLLYSKCGKVTAPIRKQYPSKDTLVMVIRPWLLVAALVSLQTYHYSKTMRKNFLLGV